MHDLVQRGRGVDIRAYEIASVERIAGELQPSTLTLLRDTKGLLGTILEECQRVQPDDRIGDDLSSSAAWTSASLPFERAIDATMALLGSHQIVEEIAFIAQLELRQREERLGRVRPNQGGIALLGECDSSLRRIRKALNAVDAAIARVEAVAPLLDFTSELQTSLSVRRAYAKFRVRVMAGGDPTPGELRTRLRGVGTQIAKLVGWDIYPEMRVGDRLLLRDLQQRVLEWLRGGADAATGLRLWQDLSGCIEMFALVNRRQELLEHDGAVLKQIAQQLAAPTFSGWNHVRSLEGLDPELDQVISAQAPDVDTLRPIVARLGAQYGSKPSTGDLSW